MTDRSVTHSTFTIERRYPVPPAAVFAAFADPKAKATWFVGPDNWQSSNYTSDFRVGGRESVSGGAPGGPVHSYLAVFADIVQDERIVTTYEMLMDDARISVSVATVELTATAAGTTFVLTEQGAYLDGYDTAAEREHGTQGLLDNLGGYLTERS